MYSNVFVFVQEIMGPVGFCAWKKRWTEYQKRTYIVKQFCCDIFTSDCKSKQFCYVKEGDEITEYRQEEESESAKSRAISWSTGADPNEGDRMCCNNPWTGQTYCHQE